MFITSEASIRTLIIHSVGNKLKGDNFILSNSSITINSDLDEVLHKFMFGQFKSNELYSFSNLTHNSVYLSIKQIFSSYNSFVSESKKIAKHLFEATNNPKINGGNLFIAFFKDIIFDDELVNAIGLFKTESADTFLKIKSIEDKLMVERDAGISISKIAKGAIIFNKNEDDGYLISLVDRRGKNEEIAYWSESFLNLVAYKNDYYHTKNTMNCIGDFVTHTLPEIYSMNKSEQTALLHTSLEYFKDNDNFAWNEFAKEVFIAPEVIGELDSHKSKFEKENDVEIAEIFTINVPAVKKEAKLFKSVIKLDDKFDIIIHKDNENLIRGKDTATGLNFYQLLFKNEE
jgi:hypothetical protein